MTPRSYNLADLFELVADTVPKRVAIVHGERRVTYEVCNRRASRLAAYLHSTGLEPGDRIAILARNRVEWIESFLAAFKARLVPVNLNYRYVAGELAEILADADVRALVVEDEFVHNVVPVVDDVETLETLIVIGDAGARKFARSVIGYEAALEVGATREPADGPRSSDDLYVVYTGGTTGRPKGVLWRSEDLFFSALLGGGAQTGVPVSSPDELRTRVLSESQAPVNVIPTPLMHGGAQWTALIVLYAGGRVVMPTSHSLDASELLGLVEVERATGLVVAGDAIGAPLADALEKATQAFDLSSLSSVSSGAAPLAPAIRQRLTRLMPKIVIRDGYGSSESGSVMSAIGGTDGGTRFELGPEVAVLDDAMAPISPGSDAVGWLARTGHLPLGYHKDPDLTARTFRTDAIGRRWAITGDRARVLSDSTVMLLGRESSTINTGGEKVFAEEVEAVLRSHPGIGDVAVVGLPDQRFGQRIVALVQPRESQAPTLDMLQEHCRQELAGYKVPRELQIVDIVPRTNVGKIDRVGARALVS